MNLEVPQTNARGTVESRPAAATTVSRCPSCDRSVKHGAYCSACGESLHVSGRLHLGHFLHEAFHFQTHLDNKVVRTLVPLLTRPGLLTQAWLQGRRQPYAKPIQLFVVLNLVFFLLASSLGVHLLVVDEPVLRQGLPGLGPTLLEAQRARHGLTGAQYAWVFNLALEPHKKWVFLILTTLVALGLKLLHPRRAIVGHLVFAIHFSCLLFLYFVVLGLIQAVAAKTPWGLIDNRVLMLISLLLLGAYGALALRRVMALVWWRAAAEGVLVAMCFYPTMMLTERLALLLAFRSLGG